jgi:hypothetical protein
MDLLLSVLSLIIAIIIGVILAYSLNIKLPIQMGFIIALLFIMIMYLFDKYNKSVKEHTVIHPSPNPIPSSSITTKPVTNINKGAGEDDDEDALPFDNLEPGELMKRLNMIYEATSNPVKATANNQSVMTDSDKALLLDGSSLASTSSLHLTYTNWLYPQLTKEQVNVDDCTNYESGSKSCIQKPSQLNDYPLKSCSKYNIPPDDYSKSMEHALMRAGGVPVLEAFTNQSDNSLYYNATSWSNNKNKANLCRTCKVGVCKNDVCF